MVDAARKLLAKYPDDSIALSYLSIVPCVTEDYEKCVKWCETAARADASFLPVFNLARAYASLGDYDMGRNTFERYLERDPNNALAPAVIGQIYLATGHLAEAQRESEKSLRLDPGNARAVLLKGDVAHVRGDFAASEREYALLLDQAAVADRRIANVRLGWLYLTQGRLGEAWKKVQGSTADGGANSWLGLLELEAGLPDLAVKTFQDRLADPAVASDPLAALYARAGLGQSYVAKGDIRAQQALDDLKAAPAGLFAKLKTRLVLSLSGALAVKRGDGRTAVADLERAVATLPYQFDSRGSTSRIRDEHGAVVALLAQAYEVAGDLAKARATYEKITALTTGRLAYGATYARAFYHLGLIAEKQGDRARARAQFQKFLDLWKDADKGLPEVADARKRMGQ